MTDRFGQRFLGFILKEFGDYHLAPPRTPPSPEIWNLLPKQVQPILEPTSKTSPTHCKAEQNTPHEIFLVISRPDFVLRLRIKSVNVTAQSLVPG
jgi:hypothetical protein